jgi:hypothetical protein
VVALIEASMHEYDDQKMRKMQRGYNLLYKCSQIGRSLALFVPILI